MQKSWYMLNECKQHEEYTDEYNEKMAFYEKICADKKPYFFGYNYPSLMKEYRQTTNMAQTNARQKFRMELEDMIEAYTNGEMISQDQKAFVERFLRSLKLDSSESTCNLICWEVEKVFDNKSALKKDNIDAYKLFRRDTKYSPNLLDKIVSKCKKSEKKRAIRCVLSFLLNSSDVEDEQEYYNIDFDIDDILSEVCNNEEVLCDLLLDYCYQHNGNKEILWTVCGDTLVNRLMEQYKMYYPMSTTDGEFSVQGKTYTMTEYISGGEQDEF